MAEVQGWSRPFEDPIALPDDRTLITPRDAATYITKLPKAENDAPEWQIAMEMPLLAAEHRRPVMFVWIGCCEHCIGMSRRRSRDRGGSRSRSTGWRGGDSSPQAKPPKAQYFQ